MGVAFPVDADDVVTLARYAKEHNLPLVPRGAGTQVTGAAVGAGVIVDFSRHMRARFGNRCEQRPRRTGDRPRHAERTTSRAWSIFPAGSVQFGRHDDRRHAVGRRSRIPRRAGRIDPRPRP